MLKGSEDTQAVAIGGELKNSFCVLRNGMLYLSPYVGDMADVRTVKALDESLERMTDMLEAQPQTVVCDKHPMYNTVMFAEEYAKKNSLPLVQIQHHYAHILACMAENNYQSDVIGLSLDGTGYGEDKTIWGGEILLSNYFGFARLGSIAPFIQTGGDLSAKEGWRCAAALIRDSFENGSEVCKELGVCSEQEYKLLAAMAEKGLNSVKSTSAGRLFDAVSAVLGIRRASTFEGEASTALMYHAQLFERKLNESYISDFNDKLISDEGGFITLNTTALVRHLAEQRLAGEDSDRLAYEFHFTLAKMLISACERVRELTSQNTVALSGGVFQNKLLVTLTNEGLKEKGFNVLLHSLVPPNDGGIALGQAAYAAFNPINN